MFKDQQGGQNVWGTVNEGKNDSKRVGRSDQRPVIENTYLYQSCFLSFRAILYFPEFLAGRGA